MNYKGNDKYGRQKSQYLDKIKFMDDKQLHSECFDMIYQSARCSNNPRADWHWMVDACYDETKRRNKVEEIYTRAFNQCVKEHAA